MAQGNGFVLAVLRSPAHWLLSRMVIELRYTGRRTGREYVLPLQYAGSGERIVVRPQAVERSTWWRGFRAPTPVIVRLRGRIGSGVAQVVLPHDPLWEPARELYVSRWRTSAKRTTGPLVVISIDPAVR
jgi:F420H(2)-dependent quinone reductase